jgi:uncharacterized protein (TIGR01777 family)
MKLIVTGGTGFIGRSLCQALAATGHELVVLTRNPRSSTSPRLRYVGWQPGSAGAWVRGVDGADGIAHLAGESLVARRWTAEQKARILTSRVGTTNALVEAISKAQHKPAVLVSASAIGYYGPHGDEILSEEAPPGSDFLATLCQQWERAAQAAQGFGVRVVRLRIGLVLARDGGALAKMLPPFRWGLGGPLGSGRQWVSWIHRDDLINLFRWALEDSRVAGILNATAPNPVTMREFAKTLGRVLHRPAMAPVPAFVLRLMFGEMAQMLLTGQRVVPDAATRLGYQFTYPRLVEALSACMEAIS